MGRRKLVIEHEVKLSITETVNPTTLPSLRRVGISGDIRVVSVSFTRQVARLIYAKNYLVCYTRTILEEIRAQQRYK